MCCPVLTSLVLLLRDHLEVIRIDARNVATQVVDLQAVWDVSPEKQIGQSVSADRLIASARADSRHPVAISIQRALSVPTLTRAALHKQLKVDGVLGQQSIGATVSHVVPLQWE